MAAESKDIELATNTAEVDDIAAREAIDDERIKTEQKRTGGALEV